MSADGLKETDKISKIIKFLGKCILSNTYCNLN